MNQDQGFSLTFVTIGEPIAILGYAFAVKWESTKRVSTQKFSEVAFEGEKTRKLASLESMSKYLGWSWNSESLELGLCDSDFAKIPHIDSLN